MNIKKKLYIFVFIFLIFLSFQSNPIKAQSSNNTSKIETEVKKYIGDEINNIGFGYYNLSTGETVVINGNKNFFAASTVKVPINMMIMDMYKNGKIDLTERIKYEKEDYEGGTGILQGKDLSKPIEIKCLSNYSIMYSDNIATRMLLRKIGYENWYTYKNNLVEHKTERGKNLVCVNDCMKIWKKLYYNPNNNEHYNELISTLKHTVFHDRLDKYIPNNIVAHKIGNYSDCVHDVGIVYTEKPYIIIVLTNNLRDSNEKISNISKIVFNIHKFN